MINNILFIQTGGTIDKDYPQVVNSYGFEITTPAVKRILHYVYPGFRYQIVELLKKDSLDLTSKDREMILQTCLNAANKKIIITHGTDTMIKTAQRLSKIKNKIIILTGSLLPEKFTNSDAAFNIGTAVGAINILSCGVYIAMSGKIFPWQKCQKSAKTAHFIRK